MFKCEVCENVYSSEEDYNAHMKSEHQGCEECEDEFYWPDAEHECYYTETGVSPPNNRVIEQNLYQGYFYCF